MQLAQVNVALLRAPLDSLEMREFVAALDRVNRLSEHSPGFLWRLRGPHDQHGVSVITEDGRPVLVDLGASTRPAARWPGGAKNVHTLCRAGALRVVHLGARRQDRDLAVPVS